jgi:hypothetical protein
MESVQRSVVERTVGRRRSKHRWVEHVALGAEAVRIDYRDNGSTMARVPWLTYRAVGVLAGSAMDITGPYVAEPNWWRRERTELAPDVTAEAAGRGIIAVECDGDRFLLRSGPRGRTILEHDEETLATFPFAYGGFDLATDRLSATSSVVVIAVVGSGAHRLVARGRLLDAALLDTASPFRRRAAR